MSRPIDADLLGLTDMEIIMCDGDYKEALKMLIDKIEDAPTIESEPQWIPVSERLPEEHDSIFKRYYGTDKWRNAMFQSSSEKVITTCEFADGTRFTETNMTCDGKWRTDKYPPRTVIAWMPLPEPYREEGGSE